MLIVLNAVKQCAVYILFSFWQMGYSKIHSHGQNLYLVMKVSYGLLIFLISSFISLNTPSIVVYIVFLMMPIADVSDGINLLIVSALIRGRLLPHVFHCESLFDLF